MKKRAVAFVVLSLIVAAGLSAADADAKGDAVKKDLASLKGTWVIVSAERDGKNVTDNTVTLTYDGAGRATVKKGTELLFDGTIKIDPTKKPKTLDVTQDSEGENKGKTIPGIYEIDGDTLKVCSGKDRPTEFSSKPGSGYFLRVYKREKK